MRKFSVLTASCNNLRFIKQCVESVAKQTYQHWEHIIVDDCSTDGSFEWLSSIGDTRVKVVRNEVQKYCSSTYAEALKHATGEICGVLDGDDVLDETAIAQVVAWYEKFPEIDFIYTQHHWCDQSLKKVKGGVSALPQKKKSLAEMALMGKHCFSHWRTFKTVLSNRSVLFPEGLRVSVDKNLGFSLEEIGNGGFLPIPLYYYRYYKGNMSLKYGSQQKETTKRLAKDRLTLRASKRIVPCQVRLIK